MKDIEMLKRNGIDVDGGVEILGDIEMYNETLQDFLDEMETRMPKLEEYYKVGDMANYAILVHAIKGDSKYLGFTKLAEMALEHQLKSQDDDYDYVKEHYQELIVEVNRIKGIVEKYL